MHSVGFQYASSLQRRRDSFLKIMNRNVVLAWELWHGDLGDEVGQAILKQQKQQLTQRQTWGNTTIFSLFIIITSVIQMLIFNKRCNKQARLTLFYVDQFCKETKSEKNQTIKNARLLGKPLTHMSQFVSSVYHFFPFYCSNTEFQTSLFL